jgi:hypothetical protein
MVSMFIDVTRNDAFVFSAFDFRLIHSYLTLFTTYRNKKFKMTGVSIFIVLFALVKEEKYVKYFVFKTCLALYCCLYLLSDCNCETSNYK